MRGLGHEVLLVGPSAFARASFGHDPKLIVGLKKFAPNILYELLELGYNVPAYVRLHRACRKFRPDFIYERYNLYTLAGTWCRRLAGVPLVLEVNAPLARERATFGGLGLSWLASLLERWVWRGADFVLPVSQVLGNEIRQAGVATERIAVLPNAIDPEKFAIHADTLAAKSELQLSGKIVLGFTGFVRSWHGLDLVVDLLARGEAPPNLHCLIIGEGPAIVNLEAQARDLGVSDRVTFAGLVGRDRIARYVAAFDIALLPRCVEYCSPLKLFEYMAAGKPTVAAAIGQIEEVIEHGKTGLLYPSGDHEQLAQGLASLLYSPELSSAIGTAAREKILTDYTWKAIASRVTDLANALLEEKTGAEKNFGSRKAG